MGVGVCHLRVGAARKQIWKVEMLPTLYKVMYLLDIHVHVPA